MNVGVIGICFAGSACCERVCMEPSNKRSGLGVFRIGVWLFTFWTAENASERGKELVAGQFPDGASKKEDAP